MILQKVFATSAIKVNLESESKEELFEELVDHLSKNFPADARFPRVEIIAALEAREAKMSTGIAKGIALPHATVEGLDHELTPAQQPKDALPFRVLDADGEEPGLRLADLAAPKAPSCCTVM